MRLCAICRRFKAPVNAILTRSRMLLLVLGVVLRACAVLTCAAARTMTLDEFVPWYRNLEARLWAQQRGRHVASVSAIEEQSYVPGRVRHHVDVPNWPQHSTALISVAAAPSASADDEHHATMQGVLAAARAAQDAGGERVGALPSLPDSAPLRRHALPDEHSLVAPGAGPRTHARSRPQGYDLAQLVSHFCRPLEVPRSGLQGKVQALR